MPKLSPIIEVFQPPLYFAWRREQGLPYVVHFYVLKKHRSFRRSIACVKQMLSYFTQHKAKVILLNARDCDKRVQKAIEYFFRVKPYGGADDHQFYLVEV